MKMLPAILLLVLGSSLHAQSNTVIDALLSQKRARFADASQLLLNAGGIIPDSATPEIALDEAKARKWVDVKKNADDPMRLDELSLLAMKSLSMKGGIMFSLLPSKRYAHREFAYLGIIKPTDGASRFVSGEEVVRFLGSAFEHRGGSK